MIFAVINQKGGAGKTTLAVHLAVRLLDAGRRIAFVDNDPQRSATRWLQAAAPQIPVHTITQATRLVEGLGQLDKSYDAVVCDGAPRLNDETHVLMYFAGRILIPVRPSMLDLQATLETKIAIDKVRDARLADGLGEPDVRLILNMVRTIGEQSKVMRKALRDLGMPLASTSIGLRDAYSKAVVDDTTVTRMTKDKGAVSATEELLKLFDEVLPNELTHSVATAA